MQCSRIRSAFLAFFMLFSLFTTAQQDNNAVLDVLDSTFQQYAENTQQPDLFLHIDKTIYTNQENIWFTAYVLSTISQEKQHTLYVVLVEEATKKIRVSDRFVIEKGLGAGSLYLPDSLAAGEYRLLAYTNSYLTHPAQAIFQQSVILKKTEANTFKLSFLPATAAPTAGDSLHFTYKVLTSYGGLASGGEMAYTLSADGNPIQTGRKKISPFGEVDFGLLKRDVFNKKVKLTATITRQKDKQTIKADVPLFEQTAFVRFYPESGNLVQEHPSRMAVEIKNGMGIPLATRGQLREEGTPIANFTTDQYGVAYINWVPKLHKIYTVTTEDTARQLVYHFPAVAAAGYTLRIIEPVIEDSSFQIELYAPDTGICHLMLHNYRTSFFNGRLLMKSKSSSLRLSVKDIPEGVATITVFDKAGVPQAERAIYIKKANPLKVQLTTDSSSYHHRAKLQLKVKVTTSQGQPVRALFSLACVLSSRIDSSRAADIVRYQHFDRFLPAASAMPGGQYLDNTNNMERLLLTRFWTRYKWEEMKAVPTNIAIVEKDCDAGDVLYQDRKVKVPVQLMIIAGKQSYSMTTDSSGHFSIPTEALRMPADSKATIVVMNQKDFRDYKIKIYNECKNVDTALATARYPDAGYLKAELSVQEQQYLKTAMQAVVVTAKTNTFTSGVFRSTNCNDWVCMFNVLNCPNHPFGMKPVSGNSYRYRGGEVIYKGCKDEEEPANFMQQVKGAYYPKEFYVADYEKFNPTEPEMMSTMFWTYTAMTDEQGEATIKFSTNDLTGRFTCVLQGYSGQGTLSGKTWFRVIESPENKEAGRIENLVKPINQ
jgi:hypothetical protein